MNTLPLELTVLSPLWIVISGAVALLCLEMFLKNNARRAAPWLAGAFLVSALAGVLQLLCLNNAPVHLFNRAVVVNPFTLALGGICLLSALLACVFSAHYLRQEKAVTGEYYALLLLSVSGMLTLVMAAEFLTLFIGLELMSIAGYVLTGYFRTRENSAEAALKYFMVGVFASGFLLYGIALLYGASGTTHFQELRLFIEQGGSGSSWVLWGAALLLVGLGFKSAMVPFHAWAPDVYEGAAAPVSAFLATGIKAAGFGVFVRLFTETFNFPGSWSTAFAVLAVLTMTLGNLGALGQRSVKRLLAYSSVAHAGYLAIALTVACTAQAASVEHAVAFYLLAYTLMTAGAFGWVAWAGRQGERQVLLEDYQGLGFRHPWMGLMMCVFLFSLAGMAPLAGFFGKYYLFKLAVDHGLLWLVIVAVLNSFVSAFYYLRVAVYLYTKPSSDAPVAPIVSSFGTRLALSLCALGSVIVGFIKLPF